MHDHFKIGLFENNSTNDAKFIYAEYNRRHRGKVQTTTTKQKRASSQQNTRILSQHILVTSSWSKTYSFESRNWFEVSLRSWNCYPFLFWHSRKLPLFAAWSFCYLLEGFSIARSYSKAHGIIFISFPSHDLTRKHMELFSTLLRFCSIFQWSAMDEFEVIRENREVPSLFWSDILVCFYL